MSRLPIRCYCSGHCPPEQGSNGTCWTKPGGYCYASVQEVITEEKRFEAEWSYGCLPPEERGYMQCQGYLSPHTIPRSIKCCSFGDLCNVHLKPSYVSHSESKYGSGHSFKDPYHSDFDFDLPHLLMIILPTILLVVGLVALIFTLFQRLRSTNKSNSSSLSMIDSDSNVSLNSDHHKNMYSGDSIKDITNSSGAGVPQLVQRTIASEINFIKYIGGGRFGQVFHASWRGDDVAVKMFKTTEEASWRREHEIFNTILLRHENILGFIASDIRGTGGQTQMLLITEYHPNGSLFDFLTSHVVDEYEALKLMYTSLCGLCHLHQDINPERSRWNSGVTDSGYIEKKPAIAHRDIKSKNILVKSDGTCCIADFGLCVLYETKWGSPDVLEHREKSKEHREKGNVPDHREKGQEHREKGNVPDHRECGNIRVGTKRYMAPEVLDSTIRADDFESFKRSDMYSFSLVLWEILRRTSTDHGNHDGYSLPYAEDLPNDPSFNDMMQVVCEPTCKRPPLSDRWIKNELLKPVVRLMVEGWSRNPKVRPTARKMKKDLGIVFEKCGQMLVCDLDSPMTSPVGRNRCCDSKYLDGKRMASWTRGSLGSRTSDYETDRGTNESCSSGRLYGGSLSKKQMMRQSPTLESNNVINKTQIHSPVSDSNGKQYLRLSSNNVINKTQIQSPVSDSNGKQYFRQSLSPWIENQKNDNSFIA